MIFEKHFREIDVDGMANSVDPDQTVPLSSLIWVCTVCPEWFVQKLMIIAISLLLEPIRA